MTREQLRILLLGNPDFMRRLTALLVEYDTDADPDKTAERIVELVAREVGEK